MKPIGRYKVHERPNPVSRYVGKLCRVTYRPNGASSFGERDRDIEGMVLGCSYPMTNGNSTGDLIIGPKLGNGFVYPIEDPMGRGRWEFKAIALANVHTIEEIDVLKEES